MLSHSVPFYVYVHLFTHTPMHTRALCSAYSACFPVYAHSRRRARLPAVLPARHRHTIVAAADHRLLLPPLLPDARQAHYYYDDLAWQASCFGLWTVDALFYVFGSIQAWHKLVSARA